MKQNTLTESESADYPFRSGANMSRRDTRVTEPRSRLDPKEGARLVRAFLNIGNPTLREAVLSLVEDLAVVE